MSIAQNLAFFQDELKGTNCRLIAVSKTHPPEAIREAYAAGQRIFGENKVQEMTAKQQSLPSDIEWHLIGHLQTNKIKYIAPFVHTIQSIDSLKLLKEVEKQASKHQRIINCLLQIYIATEETKFGLAPEEAMALIESEEFKVMQHVRITGVMGIATNTNSTQKLTAEFRSLKNLFTHLKEKYFREDSAFAEVSMGMSSDYKLAIAEGSTMIRVGSAIFGARNYAK